MLLLALLPAAPVALPAAAAAAAELRVRVEDVRSKSGQVRAALYDAPLLFPGEEGRFLEVAGPAAKGAVELVFTDVPPGTYAIAVFHDANGNGALDHNLYGVATEGYGFGNDAFTLLGAPDFADAAVTVTEPGGTTVVSLHYW